MSIEQPEMGPLKVELEWTGERYLPEVGGDVALEHLHRYAMARELAHGKVVLDMASGEGYGSHLLSAVASQVIGVDLSAETVRHASEKYARANLEFRVGSCAAIPLPDQSVDLVVSFETIEHHDQHEEMMREIKRVLRPDGVLIISSPDKQEYSITPGYNNPYHVKELYRHEFEQLLARYFKSIAMYGQRIIYGSGILLEEASGPTCSYRYEDFSDGPAKGMAKPLYLIAIVSDTDLPSPCCGIFEGNVKDHEIVSKLTILLRDREQKIIDLNHKIELIYNSNSWKWTAPLRFLRDDFIDKLVAWVKAVRMRSSS